MIQQLNENWILQSGTAEGIRTNIPCSVYDCLIRAGKIPDPYFGENQYAALELSDGNYVFEHTFSPARDILSCEKIYLRFNGIAQADVVLSLEGGRLKIKNVIL